MVAFVVEDKEVIVDVDVDVDGMGKEVDKVRIRVYVQMNKVVTKRAFGIGVMN